MVYFPPPRPPQYNPIQQLVTGLLQRDGTPVPGARPFMQLTKYSPHGPADAMEDLRPLPFDKFKKRIGDAAGRVWAQLVCRRSDVTGQVRMSINGVIRADERANPKAKPLTRRQVQRSFRRLKQFQLLENLGHSFELVPDSRLGGMRPARIFHRAVHGIHAEETAGRTIVFGTWQLAQPRAWGGARTGAGRPRTKPRPPPIWERMTKPYPEMSDEHFLRRKRQVQQDFEELARAEKDYQRQKRAAKRAAKKAGIPWAEFKWAPQPDIQAGSTDQDLILLKKKYSSLFLKEERGLPAADTSFFFSGGEGERAPILTSYALAEISSPTSTKSSAVFQPGVAKVLPAKTGPNFCAEKGVSSSRASDPGMGATIPKPSEPFVEGCGYLLGGSNHTTSSPELPRWGKGCLPPFPAPDIMVPAKQPQPPKIPSNMSDEAAVDWVMRAYRGACEARYKTPCKMLSARGALQRSQFFPTVRGAVKDLRERDIAPAAWIAFSIDEWRGFGKDRTKTGKPVFPPLRWMFSTKRIAEQEAWFLGKAHLFFGGQTYYGPTGKDVMRRMTMMQVALMRRGLTGETEAQLKEVFFPGHSFEQKVADSNRETAEMQRLLNDRLHRGDWLGW